MVERTEDEGRGAVADGRAVEQAQGLGHPHGVAHGEKRYRQLAEFRKGAPILVAPEEFCDLLRSQLRKRETPDGAVLAEYSVEGLTRGEILLLSHCITLTPGTLTVEVATDFSLLRLHIFDGENAEEVLADIRTGLEKPILAFTR